MWMCPLSVKAANAPACSRERACVPMSNRRLSTRSTHTPATGESRKMGNWLANATKPSNHAEPVRW